MRTTWMKYIALSIILLGCVDLPRDDDNARAETVPLMLCPANCDSATPPQCMSLIEAQPLAASPNFAPWFVEDICPIQLDISGKWTKLEPWFCDSTQWFPEACMAVYGPQPAGGLQTACCHPDGTQLINGCANDSDCPHPASTCFVRFCAQTGVCAVSAKPSGSFCGGTSGACATGDGDFCVFTGPPPVCDP